MPKEVVLTYPMFTDDKQGETPLTALDEGVAGDIYRRGAVLRWGRNGYVELGVAKLEVSTHVEREPHYLKLNRDEINKLIRNLRKARDQAFGADA